MHNAADQIAMCYQAYACRGVSMAASVADEDVIMLSKAQLADLLDAAHLDTHALCCADCGRNGIDSLVSPVHHILAVYCTLCCACWHPIEV